MPKLLGMRRGIASHVKRVTKIDSVTWLLKRTAITRLSENWISLPSNCPSEFAKLTFV